MQAHPGGMTYNVPLTNQPHSCEMPAIEDGDRRPSLMHQQAPASCPPWVPGMPLPHHSAAIDKGVVNSSDPIPKEASSPAHSFCQQSDTERPRSVTPIDSAPISAPIPQPAAPVTVPTSTITAGVIAAANRRQILANAPPRRVVRPRPHDHDWPSAIINISFFNPCNNHAEDQKNEVHFYCLGCSPTEGTAMCQHCLHSHAAACNGKVLQVYRYMYNDVIRIADFGKLTPLGDVQAYKANGHPAVHLRPKEAPKTKSPAGFTGRCGGCRRALSSEWTYCSLACKLGLAHHHTYGVKRSNSDLPGDAETCTASLGREPVRCRGGVSDEETDTAARYMTKRRSNIGMLRGAKRRKTEWPMRSSVF